MLLHLTVPDPKDHTGVDRMITSSQVCLCLLATCFIAVMAKQLHHSVMTVYVGPNKVCNQSSKVSATSTMGHATTKKICHDALVLKLFTHPWDHQVAAGLVATVSAAFATACTLLWDVASLAKFAAGRQ